MHVRRPWSNTTHTTASRDFSFSCRASEQQASACSIKLFQLGLTELTLSCPLLAIFQKASHRTCCCIACLEVAHYAGHRPMLSQLHGLRQRHSLAAGFGHGLRPQTAPPPRKKQSPSSPARRARRCTISSTAAGGAQGSADALLPQPPEDGPLGVIPAASSQSCKARAA